MYIYLIPPLTILLVWMVALRFRIFLSTRRAIGGLTATSAVIWNVAAGSALIGTFAGLVIGSLSVTGSAQYFGSEVLGALLAGGLGAAIGRGTRLSTAPEAVVGFVYSILYWMFAFEVAGTWLLLSAIGDCFQDTSCTHNQQQAVPQASMILLIALLTYIIVLVLRRLRMRSSIAASEA